MEKRLIVLIEEVPLLILPLSVNEMFIMYPLPCRLGTCVGNKIPNSFNLKH